jgi:hypothetical protein
MENTNRSIIVIDSTVRLRRLWDVIISRQVAPGIAPHERGRQSSPSIGGSTPTGEQKISADRSEIWDVLK